MREHIVVKLPGVPPQVMEIEAEIHEDDRDIALRLGRGFPVGTILSIDTVRWAVVSHDPVEVVEAAEPRKQERLKSEPPPGVEVEPGQTWRPKDPRRKSGFRVKAVVGDTVVADDGRTVKLKRMKRYERVG